MTGNKPGKRKRESPFEFGEEIALEENMAGGGLTEAVTSEWLPEARVG